MDSASNELHLTPENIRDIQELVLAITPDFREELWERVSLQQAKEREEEAARLRATTQAMQQMMNASANNLTNQLGAVTRRAFTPQLAANLYNSSPLFNQLLQNGMGSVGQPIYQSVGAGFTPYGPLSEEMGLTLVKTLDKALP